jgi:hypothetical protein
LFAGLLVEAQEMREPEGGLGGTTGRGIRDVRLVERAIREWWPIPRALRGPLIGRLAGIVQAPMPTRRAEAAQT